MKNRFLWIGLWLLGMVCVAGAQAEAKAALRGKAGAREKVVKLKLVQTSDLHGNFYPYNFITGQAWKGSLARVCSFVEQERQVYGKNLILLDNGDILQGQPTVYYYNYIDTVSTHVCADMMNYLGYDAGNMGNHDVETGRAVFDRWIGECRFPVLGANIVDTKTGEPYLPPYCILHRDGVKVAVLGMVTPAIPAWLPENLWKGLRFEDMEATARRWMKVMREKERPDVVVGVFHAGQQAFDMAGKYRENASLEVATRVPGFDVVLMGHDHARECRKVVNVAGDSVLVMDPASNGRVVSEVSLTLHLKKGKVVKKDVQGALADMDKLEPSEAFLQRFAPQQEAVKAFVGKKIGTLAETVSTRPAYVGSSAFVDWIHALQLEISGAEISFAAPLSLDAEIRRGEVHVSDMFNLYKYENMLYVMSLSGQEIKDFLEMSYGLWTRRMTAAGDAMLWLKEKRTEGERTAFEHPSFNFDSAAGIRYTVDVTKPQGEKVTIVSMADGSPFDLQKRYKVALNSYRGNGGGELLTKGAGIPKEELKSRILFATDKDLRYYLMQTIEKQGRVEPKALHHWKFVPEEWTVPAAKRELERLFP